MKYIIILLIGFLLYGCGSASDYEYKPEKTKTKYVFNPCKDSLYLALKIMPLDSLSDREYQYIRDKEKDCNEYTMFEAKQKTYAEDVESVSNMRSVWIGLAVVSVVAGVIIVIMNNASK